MARATAARVSASEPDRTKSRRVCCRLLLFLKRRTSQEHESEDRALPSGQYWAGNVLPSTCACAVSIPSLAEVAWGVGKRRGLDRQNVGLVHVAYIRMAHWGHPFPFCLSLDVHDFFCKSAQPLYIAITVSYFAFPTHSMISITKRMFHSV